jgi:hypothetical protein
MYHGSPANSGRKSLGVGTLPASGPITSGSTSPVAGDA